jgi:hypothetical protein
MPPVAAPTRNDLVAGLKLAVLVLAILVLAILLFVARLMSVFGI